MLLLYGSLHTVKKLLAIAFTCVYLLLTVGVIQNTHYCMGRISASPSSVDEIHNACHTSFENQFSNRGPEFFILSTLYSEAMIVFLA